VSSASKHDADRRLIPPNGGRNRAKDTATLPRWSGNSKGEEMKVRTIMGVVLACLAIEAGCVSTANAASSWHKWPGDEQWAFMDSWTKVGQEQSLRWPSLYAVCLLQAAMHKYPSYAAFVMSPKTSSTWLSSPMVQHCIVTYGIQHTYDNPYYGGY
jgi:hypothetical protein